MANYTIKFETIGYHSISYNTKKFKARNINDAVKKAADIHTSNCGEKRGSFIYLYKNEDLIAKYAFKYRCGIGFGAYICNASKEEISDINNWEFNN